MSAAAILAFASAACSGALAAATVVRARRSLPRWSFAAGLALLAAESLCVGFGLVSTGGSLPFHWQIWRLVIVSLVPAAWLLFSATYARGNAPQSLSRQRLPLLAATALPFAYWFFHDTAVAPDG